MPLTLKDSPLSICILSLLLICLTYLVYMHPEHFSGFFHFALVCGFVVLTGLLVAFYRPFVRYYKAYIDEKCRQTPFKPHLNYHEQLKQNTMKELDILMKNEKYLEFERIKKEDDKKPVVLCKGKTEEEIQEEAKELEELETQIFQQSEGEIGYKNA